MLLQLKLKRNIEKSSSDHSGNDANEDRTLTAMESDTDAVEVSVRILALPPEDENQRQVEDNCEKIIVNTEELLGGGGADEEELLYYVPATDSRSRLLLRIFELHEDEMGSINDCFVQCSDGAMQVPAPLLAATSPVFKAAATADSEGCGYSVVLPDVTEAEFRLFLRRLCLPWQEFPGDSLSEDMSILEKVTEVLCAGLRGVTEAGFKQEAPAGSIHAKNRVGIKRAKSKKIEPYVRTEIVEKSRAETTYGLRRKIKRKCFVDEVSEASDLDMSSEEASESESKEREVAMLPQDFEESDENDDDEEGALRTEEVEEPHASGADVLVTVRFTTDGSVEVLDKLTDLLEDDKRGATLGRVIAVTEKKTDASSFELVLPRHNPRSVLKANSSTTHHSDLMICSACQVQFSSMHELRHHAALAHAGSKLFQLPEGHSHHDCHPCKTMMESYERLSALSQVSFADICFVCPHCTRRYVGDMKRLLRHLDDDHRNHLGTAVLDTDSPNVMKLSDPRSTQCNFCLKEFSLTDLLNRHLLYCDKWDLSNQVAGLFCKICGKVFSSEGLLMKHQERRHTLQELSRPRLFVCLQCPVTCATEEELAGHKERDHPRVDPDQDGFVLHRGCERCNQLQESYARSKERVASSELAFKCPHCFTLFYAHRVHPLRYLANHVRNFHCDKETDDFTLGQNSPDLFRAFSRADPATLKCAFCQTKSSSRSEHNAHLTECEVSDVMCRPGYLCNDCGYFAGTSRQLRDHSDEVHSDTKTGDKISNCEGSSQHGNKARNNKEVTAPCTKWSVEKKVGSSFRSHQRRCGRRDRNSRVKCDHCEMEFKRREDMQAHALIHYGYVICPIHNILFQHESEVFQHANQAESGEPPRLQCCMCNAAFRHMCHLMKHVRRHLRLSAYRCDVCAKSFNSYASLQVHQQNIHGIDKKSEQWQQRRLFVCSHCGKSFNTKGHLKEHELGVHDRDQLVSCPGCDKTFNTYKRMKKHLFNAHKETAKHYRKHNEVEAFSID